MRWRVFVTSSSANLLDLAFERFYSVSRLLSSHQHRRYTVIDQHELFCHVISGIRLSGYLIRQMRPVFLRIRVRPPSFIFKSAVAVYSMQDNGGRKDLRWNNSWAFSEREED